MARANALAAEAEKLADEVNDAHATGLAVAARAIALHMNGHWRDCLPFFDEAERIFRERCTGVAWELATGNLLRSYSLARLGELIELSKNVTQSCRRRSSAAIATARRCCAWASPTSSGWRGSARRGAQRVRGGHPHWSQRGFHGSTST